MAGFKPKVQFAPFQAVYENTLVRGGPAYYTYRSWESLFSRCYDQSNQGYPAYGARGIAVCDRWRFGENGRAGFDCFVDDMGLRPKGKSLDRLDGDKGYFLENCRWATDLEQNVNQCTTLWTEINGEKLYLSEIGRRYKIGKTTLSQRWRNGWRGERLISRPRKFDVETLTLDGETKSVRRWAKLKDFPYDRLMYRVRAGWPEKDLFLEHRPRARNADGTFKK